MSAKDTSSNSSTNEKLSDQVEGEDHNAVAYDGFNADVAARVKDLARTLSRSSSLSRVQSNTSLYSFSKVPGVQTYTNESLDPKLDPESDEFDSKLWVMNQKKLFDSDPDYYKPSSLNVSFRNLRAYGEASESDYQSTAANFVEKNLTTLARKIFSRGKQAQFDILKPMDGLVKAGEVCVVLGKPGSGCTTFLKTLAAQTYGFHVDKESVVDYDGFTPDEIAKHYRGEVVYCAESEYHLPQLPVWETLKFAALLRTPKNLPEGVSREAYAGHMTDVIMATYGLSHTKNTKVGNDVIRGVSGGERKRVSICEVALSGAKIQCWDNSTRGLDSATALEFIKALKTTAVVTGTTPLIAIYQCSQIAYDLFDKVQVMYEGYQIYFGDAKKAKDYFLKMGYECPARQTTADFLTSVTSPNERIAKKGYENKVPRTPKEFYDYWMNSPEHEAVVAEIEEHKSKVTEQNKAYFKEAQVARKAPFVRPASPYTVSFGMQVKYITKKNFLRIRCDPSITLFTIIVQSIEALVFASLFFNMQPYSDSFYLRTSAIFMATLFNALGSLLEVFALYEGRPIVEKHKNYGLYHPAAEAFGSVMSELPTKIIVSVVFNCIFYFMINLKRDAGAFFFYLLVNFTGTLTMSHMFRTLGALSKTLSEAMVPSATLLLIICIFTGFVIPTPNMHGWCRWLNYLDPIAYAFEALVANEFHGREFECSSYVPSGSGYPTSGDSRICSVVSSKPGDTTVNGDAYIESSFKYSWDHRWRNWGICLSFAVFFLITYVLGVEFNRGAMQKGEILLFQKKSLKKFKQEKADIESGPVEKETREFNNEKAGDSDKEGKLGSSGRIFHWKNLTYQVKIKSADRVILSDVSGYVKPGTITALMGASGAGKTTLLNALSARLTSGVISSGTRMVNGHHLDQSFQRSIGYVQQQDLHLETSTVREALLFSAKLRQPFSVPLKEKEAYVDYVIELLEMEKYSDAVVGVAGEGLNVEQRKRLTIGVELAAKPDLLVFLDEPTSGLDSQTAWSIVQLIRKLADQGQAILCTIHQPSAILMQEFDRLLFLQKGGKTVYFGDLGEGCKTMIEYFEKYGAPKCPADANPAEWMLEVIGAAPGSHANQDYYDVWLKSAEYQALMKELETMETELAKLPVADDPQKYKSYAAPIWYQFVLVLQRVLQQVWRNPMYIYSKFFLAIFASLFNGFVFYKSKKSLIGLQTQMFSVFMMLATFNFMVHQYLPNFVAQRDLYEVRERPSRTFSWAPFIAAQVISEIPLQISIGTVAFFCWYYPVGLQHNAADAGELHLRGALVWICMCLFYVYSSTMGQMMISFNELETNAANFSGLLFAFSLSFCGVLVSPDALPGFWIFMYRVSPMTYLVGSILPLSVSDTTVTCAANEYLKFAPANGKTCQDYMAAYISKAGGYLLESTKSSTEQCSFCTMAETNVFLKSIGIDSTDAKRNIGIFSAFIFFNIIATFVLYYIARVPKGAGKRSF